MSLKIIQHAESVEILEGALPPEKVVTVYTEEEVLQFEGWKQWSTLSQEQRENMLMQTQSAAYKEWMEEDEWDGLSLGELGQSGYNASNTDKEAL